GPQPRSFFDKIDGWAKSEMGAAGLGYIILEGDAGKGPIAKFLPPAALAALVAKCGLKSGDAVFFSADAKKERAANLAGYARTRIGRELGLINDKEFRFCWIVDFPMYEWSEEE